MILNTERLKLREIRESDELDIVEGVGNLNVSKWLEAVPHPYTRIDALMWIAKIQEDEKDVPRIHYTFGMELLKGEKMIGAISLDSIDRFNGVAGTGYWINPEFHHLGYGTEALKEVLGFAFNKLELRRIEASIFMGNSSSRGLLERFGFNMEGLRRESKVCRADGKIKDDFIYSLLKRDYRR